MKRSEVIEILEELINVELGYGDAANETARTVLDKLEQVGMQPPAIKEPCSSFVLKNGQYIQVEDSFVFTNKWDAE